MSNGRRFGMEFHKMGLCYFVCHSRYMRMLQKKLLNLLFFFPQDIDIVIDACSCTFNYLWCHQNQKRAYESIWNSKTKLNVIIQLFYASHFPFTEEKKQIFIAFSLYTNGQRLFSCKKSKVYGMLECLNGMRVISAFWVIYAHSNIVSLGGPIFNMAYLLDVCIELSFAPSLMKHLNYEFDWLSFFLIVAIWYH